MKTIDATTSVRHLIRLIFILLMASPFAIHAQPGGFGGMGGPGGGMQQGFGNASSNSGNSYGGNQVGSAIVSYDPETGQIIVITDDETNDQIASVIEKLDRPVPQVLIKVLFLEVTHTKSDDLGVEGSYEFGALGALDSLSTAFGVSGETRGGFYRILNDDLDVTVRALSERTKTDVLSRPSVLVRNNEEALITVGQEVPFIRDSRVTDNGDTINTIEYEDIGIILEVTPFINSEKMVEMYVLPEISSLSAETVPISETVNATVISKRSAETHVVVADGKTVVIGGMMEDQSNESVRKVPILGSIPFLGALFRRTVTDKSKTELLIFLTPYIVENASQLQALSEDENSKAEIANDVFSEQQRDKYIDNLKQK